MKKEFKIRSKDERKNSILIETSDGFVFYEKLTNSIHAGERPKLKELQEKVESLDYNPKFESRSLEEKKYGKMEGLVLNVTESCNFRCNYCIFSGNYENEHAFNSKKMSFDVAKKSIDLFMPRAEDPSLIAFYGGEPLNNIGLIKEIVNYTRKTYPDKKAIFSLTSNFYDADKHFETIVKENLYFLISLDGPKNIHDKNRLHQSGKPTWNKIMDNLKKLDDYSPGFSKTHVSQSITIADPDDVLEIVDFFRNKSFIPVRIGGIESKGLKKSEIPMKKKHAVFELASEFLECVDEEKQIPEIIRIIFDNKLRMMANRNRKDMPNEIGMYGACYPGIRKLFVDTDGQLYMCEKFGKRCPIGDIEEGINQDRIDSIIQNYVDIRNKNCTNGCWAQRLCTPCIHTAKDSSGQISVKGLAETCSSSKGDLLISLGMYSNISMSNPKFFDRYNHTKLN